MAESPFDKDIVRAVPVLSVFFLLLKAYVVSDYSLTTAGALITAAPLTVLVGTALSYLNLLFLLGVVVGFYHWRVHRSGTDSVSAGTDDTDGGLRPAAFALFLICVLFLPIPAVSYFNERFAHTVLFLIAAAAAIGLAWILTRFLAARTAERSLLRQVARRGDLFVATLMVILVLPTLKSAWVPAEVLVLKDDVAIQDSHPVDGKLVTSRYPIVFVISEGGDWTSVLDVKSRIVMRLPSDEIAHREVCHYRGQPPGTVPLWEFVIGYRYHSPNTFCDTLVRHHDTLLDPLVADPTGSPAP